MNRSFCLRSLMIAGWLALGAATAHADFATLMNEGRTLLAQGEFAAARDKFIQADQEVPNHPDANFFLGLSRLLALSEDPQTQTLLDRFGFSAAGRDPFDFTASLPEFGGPESFDLEYQSLRFVPDAASPNGYAVSRSLIADFPTDPAGGAVILSEADDESAQVDVADGKQILLFGQTYSTLYVGSNGYITLDGPDFEYIPTMADHFASPRVSALFADLWVQGSAAVTWRQLADRVAVTFASVEPFGGGEPNNFQVELFFNGEVRLSYLSVALDDVAIVGLSSGAGVPAAFVESNLSAYPEGVPVSTGASEFYTEAFDFFSEPPPAIYLPDDAPGAVEVRAYLNNVVLPVVRAAALNLSVPTSQYRIFLEPGELHLLTPTEIDFGDLSLLRAALGMVQVSILALNPYRMNADIDRMFNLRNEGWPAIGSRWHDWYTSRRRNVLHIGWALDLYPDLLTLESGAEQPLLPLELPLRGAIYDLVAGINFILGETDLQGDDLVAIAPQDRARSEVLRDALIAGAAAIGRETRLPGLSGDHALDLVALLQGRVDLRGLMPAFVGYPNSLFQPGVDINTYPDILFHGIYHGDFPYSHKDLAGRLLENPDRYDRDLIPLPHLDFNEDGRMDVADAVAYLNRFPPDQPAALLAPRGGETFPPGARVGVHWRLKAQQGTDCRIELRKGGAKIADLATANDGDGEGIAYVTLPANASGSDYRIRVVNVQAESGGAPNPSDESGPIQIVN